MWDPVAVRFCLEAGEGATFDLRVGGKCGGASGNPVDLEVTVRKIVRDWSTAHADGDLLDDRLADRFVEVITAALRDAVAGVPGSGTPYGCFVSPRGGVA